MQRKHKVLYLPQPSIHRPFIISILFQSYFIRKRAPTKFNAVEVLLQLSVNRGDTFELPYYSCSLSIYLLPASSIIIWRFHDKRESTPHYLFSPLVAQWIHKIHLKCLLLIANQSRCFRTGRVLCRNWTPFLWWFQTHQYFKHRNRRPEKEELFHTIVWGNVILIYDNHFCYN